MNVFDQIKTYCEMTNACSINEINLNAPENLQYIKDNFVIDDFLEVDEPIQMSNMSSFAEKILDTKSEKEEYLFVP